MAFDGTGEIVTCIISPTLRSRGKEYSAASIQDFKVAGKLRVLILCVKVVLDNNPQNFSQYN